jgi:dUTP pyrophosphatase
MGWSLQVKIKTLPHCVSVPKYATEHSSGLDLYAALDKVGYRLEPGAWKLISTGVCVEIPEGYEAQIRSRSGLAGKNGVFVLNSPGTVDSDYRGEICVILMNISDKAFMIRNGDRIAQMVFSPVVKAHLEVVDELSETKRGEGGFGSTGVSK